ncbi:MAG: type II secretion system GspH family protein, partial [Candidatus Gastranaerophilales bacterium]|nr:type II secretion system GspH family protein [Candidatus Gastranaerophilales bacterium]
MNILRKSYGFTLAEVLITLGIIGIVAALTIPGLIAQYQKEATVNKLKRSISILNQAYKLSYDDVGELEAQETKNMDSLEYFNTYWAPYIKVHTYCKSPKECNYNTYTPFTMANNKKSGWFAIEPRLRATFMTPDGFA